jgi:PRTRC genetic system ThiF family protein
MNPEHDITIAVIGCGGTGSYVVTQLAKLAIALYELKGIMIQVSAYDNDIVEKHNVGRQLYSESDIGQFKSNVIISRVNRFYGLRWESYPIRVDKCPEANIIITCVDNLETRRIIQHAPQINWKGLKREVRETWTHRLYWMDFGNSKSFGQYILSTFQPIPQPKTTSIPAEKLPNIFDLVPNIKEDKSEPSCSMAESLQQQDLFINLTLAVHGIGLLWKLLKDHRIEYYGQFINLESGVIRPITIK